MGYSSKTPVQKPEKCSLLVGFWRLRRRNYPRFSQVLLDTKMKKKTYSILNLPSFTSFFCPTEKCEKINANLWEIIPLKSCISSGRFMAFEGYEPFE
jgi:hypothetical protein